VAASGIGCAERPHALLAIGTRLLGTPPQLFRRHPRIAPGIPIHRDGERSSRAVALRKCVQEGVGGAIADRPKPARHRAQRGAQEQEIQPGIVEQSGQDQRPLHLRRQDLRQRLGGLQRHDAAPNDARRVDGAVDRSIARVCLLDDALHLGHIGHIGLEHTHLRALRFDGLQLPDDLADPLLFVVRCQPVGPELGRGNGGAPGQHQPRTQALCQVGGQRKPHAA
jgi:hypothetical protein